MSRRVWIVAAAWDLTRVQTLRMSHLNSKLKEAYVFKMELLAADCEDEELMRLSKEVTSAKHAKQVLKQWCDDNDCDVPFLQVGSLL